MSHAHELLAVLFRPQSFSCTKQMEWLLQWHHNEPNVASNHQSHDCLLNHLFRRRSKKTSKPHFTGLCEGNSPVTCEFPAQRASNVDNVSFWWYHHGKLFSSFLRYWSSHHCHDSIMTKNAVKFNVINHHCKLTTRLFQYITNEDSTKLCYYMYVV